MSNRKEIWKMNAEGTTKKSAVKKGFLNCG